MIKNYFKIAFRVFKKEKLYSFINVSGLVLGFVCCLMIFLFIKDELSYDDFHKDSDRIYRVAAAYMRQSVWEPYSTNSWPTAEKLKTSFGEIEQLVRIMRMSEIVTHGEKRFDEERMAVADENFFEVFSFPLISGNPSEALKGSNKVVISEATAKKYFGPINAMGKVLDIGDGTLQLRVSGIMEEMPSNSHFHFDFLISGLTARQIAPEAMFDNVGWDSQYVYIKMAEGSKPASMESMFPNFIDDHLAPLTSGNFKLFLQPLSDIHLRSKNGTEIEPNGNINHIYIFSIVAIFILVIASVNYMNLTIARSLRRSKEVGMRKVLGAHKMNLIGQFLSESFIVTLIAALIAFCLTLLLLPVFNQFAGKEITTNTLFNPPILMTIGASIVIIAILSGAYPSFVLSTFKPLSTLKGSKTKERFGPTLRKGLVVLQFVISIGLIASTSIVFDQLDFLKNKELGINKELLVAVPLRTMDRSQLDAFNNDLLTNSSIVRTGASNMKMPGWISNSTVYKAQGVAVDEEARKSMKVIRIDYDFFKTVETEITQGRDFSKEFPSDGNSSIILNESAIDQLGWTDPIGKWVEFDNQRFTVVGIVKDFHFESLHRKIPPTIFIPSSTYLNWAYVKVDAQNLPLTLKHIKSVYSKFVTNREFSYSFVNEDVARQYQTEEKFTEVLTIFTILAIILACLGTFGLVSFSAERKSKEIGIRKVLGASIGNVTFKLIKEFAILLLVASFIAWPLTYFFMNDWIKDFTYRTNIKLEVFAMATILALLITMGTTGFRALKAALANPIDSLREE
ncbi:ABC transporter permease [Ulvibacterium marinum]|uniref:FtsX-like permease family protein n=1 Tax=Ulvibacterium marinum TaxID=2419782 RepID=A0A3B0CGR0_9FLAO|nr:ABC transporter permease [Ulvibacterium marinum]RKN83317.1 FtsX-like permease family protein [Ulvibacterium marinum]